MLRLTAEATLILLPIVWAIFVVVFFVLGITHWRMRGENISYLQLAESQLQPGVKVKAHIAGLDFIDFADKFNRYIDYYNQTNKKQHKIQAIGYWVATATALFSLCITLL